MMCRATQKSPPGWVGWALRMTVLTKVWLFVGTAAGGEPPPPPDVAARAAYEAAATRITKSTDDPEAAWMFGRACFDWAEFATNDTQRAALAIEGMEACRGALKQNPELAAAHYYLAMNQGQLARTKGLGALKLVQEMEAHFKTCRTLDPQFDRGGPDRNLGLLYLEAPGWPVSLGNRDKARKHLGEAVQMAPEFPENRLNLMDAYARWDEMALLRHELAIFDEQAVAARETFSGSEWYWDWLLWEDRIEKLRQRVFPPATRKRSAKTEG